MDLSTLTWCRAGGEGLYAHHLLLTPGGIAAGQLVHVGGEWVFTFGITRVDLRLTFRGGSAEDAQAFVMAVLALDQRRRG